MFKIKEFIKEVKKEEIKRLKMLEEQVKKGCDKCSQWDEYFGCNKCEKV